MVLVTEFRTGDLPVGERFGSWYDLTASALIPTVFSSDHTADFQATLRALDLGTAQLSAMTYPSLQSRRTPKLIRRSDPELYQLSLTLRGEQGITQAGRDTVLGRDDLMLYDSSRPFHSRVAAAEGSTAAAVVAQVPKALLPLPPDEVDRLLAVRIPGREGIGALLAQFLARLTTGAGQYRPSDAPRLGTVLLDLLTTWGAHHLDVGTSVPPESQRRALLLEIRAFIQQRLGDPRLAPGTIAAAHNISVRSLHRLFQDRTSRSPHGSALAGWKAAAATWPIPSCGTTRSTPSVRAGGSSIPRTSAARSAPPTASAPRTTAGRAG